MKSINAYLECDLIWSRAKIDLADASVPFSQLLPPTILAAIFTLTIADEDVSCGVMLE